MKYFKLIVSQYKILIVLLLIFLPIVTHSVSMTNDDEIYKNGEFSFIIPKKWKISKESLTEDNWQYVSCSKKGLTASGLVMMKWIKDSLDINEVLLAHKDMFGKGYVNMQFEASDVQSASFNSEEALKIDYKASLLGVGHSGEMYCFYACGYTVFWCKQTADEDLAANIEGFEKIQTSFNCVSQ